MKNRILEPKAYKVELRKGLVRWYYVIKSRNGRILSTSQKYYNKHNAFRAALLVSPDSNVTIGGEK